MSNTAMLNRRTAAAAAIGLAILSNALPIHADTVEGTRSALLREKSHKIEATIYRGHARWIVRRTVFNAFERHDQAVIHIEVPKGAVATGLRTLGTLNGNPHWFAGELLEAEAAAAKYQELTGIGGYYPKDPALLSWRSQQHLTLQVFPCPPREDKTIEYTFDMPLSYRDGAYHLPLPPIGTEELLASVVVHADNPADQLLVDGQLRPSRSSVTLRHDKRVDITLVPSRSPLVEGELAVVPFGTRRVLTHLQLSAAPKLSTVPRRAQVVVVIDASKSANDNTTKAFLQAAGGYLQHLPDAQVQLLFFDRTHRPFFSSFVPVADALRELRSMKVVKQNGSNLDDALAEADRLLRERPGSSSDKRIVLVTDGLTRSSFAPGRIRGAMGASGALAHVGIVEYGAPRLERDDAHAWADAVRTTGGLVWKASAGDGIDTETREVFESWARPKQLDNVQLVGFGAPLGSFDDPPETLREGGGFQTTLILSSAMSSVRVEGELWARPVQTSFEPSAPAGRRWAALVFGSDLLDELREPEMMTLAILGGAVSPVTSYLAIEPGVRPSTEGLSEFESGSFGSGGSSVRMGACALGNGSPQIDRAAFLQEAVQAAMRSCGLRRATASVIIETTRAEIVDVGDVALTGSADPIGARCVQESIWGLDLPTGFDGDWNDWLVIVHPAPAPAPPSPSTLLQPLP